MKVKLNNRKDKVEIVESLIEKYNFGDKILDKNNHEDFYKILTTHITLDKTEAMGRKFVTFHSNTFHKCLIDSYERALASMNLYFNKHNIPNDIGYFYVIGNPCFENYFKVGCSKDVETRLIHYQTYTPKRDFYIYKYCINNSHVLSEKLILDKFSDMFENEWFKTDSPDSFFKTACNFLSKEHRIYNRFSSKNDEFLKSFEFIIETPIFK